MPAARSHACRICRQPTTPGERLCGPCKSALKRARDSTVSEAIKPTRARKRQVAAAEVAVEGVPVASAPPVNWVARGAWAIVGIALFTAGGVWLSHTRGIAGTIAPRYAVAGPESGAETIQAASTTVAPAAPVATPVEKAAPAPAVADEPRPDPRSLPSTITMPRGNGTNADAQAAAAAQAATTAPPAPAPVIEAPLPPPVAVVAPAPRPAPDRWQRLAELLARCPQGDVIARTMCEESLRIEHCQGHWGNVAACPARAEREYGN